MQRFSLHYICKTEEGDSFSVICQLCQAKTWEAHRDMHGREKNDR